MRGVAGIGNGAISKMAQRSAGIQESGAGDRPTHQSLTPWPVPANRVSGGRNVSDNGDNYNHVEEVIPRHNKHPEFPVATDRLEQPVNRR